MADYEKLKKYLLTERSTELSALQDCFALCLETGDHETNKLIRKAANGLARSGGGSEAAEVYWKTILFDAQDDFDCFMRYNERNRPLEQQFWQPRREKLMPVCRALQELEDGELDELFLSMPPRIGKSTIILMFMAWVMGRNSERSNLYCSYTDSVVKVLYSGILEMLGDRDTYSYFDVFPKAKVASTDAKDLLINLDRKKRYASFTGRSLYGTLNGACDCNGYLIGDDLISGIEEAMSKDRLNAAWAKVDNNLLPRAKESAKILWIGTRWSLTDPQGKRYDLLQNDPKYQGRRVRVLNTPALDGNDESNFEYKYGVGFSSDYYQQRRASFERSGDMASWLAQYQGEPIEREGAVFEPDDLRYYNGVLPDMAPDRTFMVVDPAWGGSDFVAAPVCSQYGDDIYVVAVVFDNKDKTFTQPLIISAIKKYFVAAVKVEGTKMTAAYGEDIDQMLRSENLRVNLTVNTTHFNKMGKLDRILANAPDIREKLIFLSEGSRSKEYSMFMQNLFSFTYNGKAKHDDAADALAMVIDFISHGISIATVAKSPFR